HGNGQLPYDPKPLCPRGRGVVHRLTGDVVSHLPGQGGQEGLHLVGLALHADLDAAVGAVADGAGDREAAGQVLGGEAEPHALHAAGVDDALGGHHAPNPRSAAIGGRGYPVYVPGPLTVRPGTAAASPSAACRAASGRSCAPVPSPGRTSPAPAAPSPGAGPTAARSPGRPPPAPRARPRAPA